MKSQNYIRDLENQYFEFEILIKNNKGSQAQIERFDEICVELKSLPNNVLSQQKVEKNILKRKIKL